METQFQNETTFYQDSLVTVTQSRYITQSKTYAMRNISSVHVFEIEKSKVTPILIILFGIPSLFWKCFLDWINTYRLRNINRV